MFIRLRIMGLVLLGLTLIAGGAWAQGSSMSIIGNVKGPDGKPVNSASVRLEGKNAKPMSAEAKTDQKGNYSFTGLASGTYKVTALVNNVPTSIDNVKPRPHGAVRVDFDIKPTAAKKAGKKAKHYVWLPARTGTHFGGGWVEVTDGAILGADRADQVSGEALQRLPNHAR